MKFRGLKVGDQIVIQEHRGSREAAVTQVGRKYFIAGRQQFRLDDGTSTSGYSHPRAYTVSEHMLSQRVAAAEKELRAFGVQVDPFVIGRSGRVLAIRMALEPMIRAAAAADSVSPTEDK